MCNAYICWCVVGFWPYLQLEKVIKGRLLVKDVKKLSPAEQTSSLESYHKVVCFFAPKFVHFEFPQMQARLVHMYVSLAVIS